MIAGVTSESIVLKHKTVFDHQRVGILLINVGTPTEPTTKAVRQYLAEFLTDKRVVSLPKFFRYLLVYGLILPFRSKKSTHAYQAVWDAERGSPLLSISESFRHKLQIELGENFKVALGMRYGQPSIAHAIDALLAEQVDEILVAPLYPQYASATTSSALEQAYEVISQKNIFPAITTLAPFYNHPTYVAAKAAIIKPHLEQKWDCILFSYHGLPFAQIRQAEAVSYKACDNDLPCPAINQDNRHCYRAQCYRTTELIAASLGLKAEDYMVSFQSRVGMNRWIGPDTESALKVLLGKDKKNILVICPSFVADCLETLEEINLRAKEDWIRLGGESLSCIPCLNDSPVWVEGFAEMINDLI